MSTSSSSPSPTRLDRLVCTARTSAPASSPDQRGHGDGRRQHGPQGQLDQHAPVTACAKVDRISITLSRSSLGELGEEADLCDYNNNERGRRRDIRARTTKSSITTTTNEPSSEEITRVSLPRTAKLNRFFSLCAKAPGIKPVKPADKLKLLANLKNHILPSKKRVGVKQIRAPRSNQNNHPLLAPSLIKTPSLTPSLTQEACEDAMIISSPDDNHGDLTSTIPYTNITASNRSPTLHAVKRTTAPFKRQHKHLLLQRCHSAPAARSFGLPASAPAPTPPYTGPMVVALAVGARTPQQAAAARVVDAYHLEGVPPPSHLYTSTNVHGATPHTRKILEEYRVAGCVWGWDGGGGLESRRRRDGEVGLLEEPDINTTDFGVSNGLMHSVGAANRAGMDDEGVVPK
ncbi:hypothetical protein BC830DRAFT_1216729 [Chytriomyces sp. MP71]|nr:hypothetical protein BC830DRAFT_1216729 [Chytriomyces sp. MP71]